MKRYRVHFRRRSENPLSPGPQDEVETIEAPSKKAAREYGKSLAHERSWWFMAVLD